LYLIIRFWYHFYLIWVVFGRFLVLLSNGASDNLIEISRSKLSHSRTTMEKYCHVFQWLRRGFGSVNRFIGSSLVVTTISSYTLKITVTIAHVTSHSKSSNSSSGHTDVPLELRNSSEVNSHSRIFSYPLGTDHAQKTQSLYCCMVETTLKTSHVLSI
jgi:hypothetical protein